MISKAIINNRLKPIYHNLANITTRVWGWHQLNLEIKEIKHKYAHEEKRDIDEATTRSGDAVDNALKKDQSQRKNH